MALLHCEATLSVWCKRDFFLGFQSESEFWDKLGLTHPALRGQVAFAVSQWLCEGEPWVGAGLLDRLQHECLQCSDTLPG